MSIYKITFSPTGGTQKITDYFLAAFTNESIAIDLTDQTFDFSTLSFKSDDICIIAVPSYGGRVPKIVVSHLKQISGNKAKAILICVYGNRAYEDTLLELQNTLKDANFHCVAAVAAVAEHSIARQYASLRPDTRDAKELASFAEIIKKNIATGKIAKDLSLPGNIPYREYAGVPMKPKAHISCIKCGLCAKKCPVGAISSGNPSTTDKEKCISCMRCIAICPKHARKVSKLLLFIAGISLKKVCCDYKKNELFL